MQKTVDTLSTTGAASVNATRPKFWNKSKQENNNRKVNKLSRNKTTVGTVGANGLTLEDANLALHAEKLAIAVKNKIILRSTANKARK